MGFFLFAFILLILLGLVWHETSHYTHLKQQKKDTMEARARFGRRLIGIVILFMVTMMTYWGIQNLKSFPSPLIFFVYWGICIFLLLSLILLVVFDLRAVFKQVMNTYLDESAEEKRFREFMEKQMNTVISPQKPFKMKKVHRER